MSIWIHEDSKILVQGITGSQGMFHATRMVEYGTDIIGGVTPGKGGQSVDLPGRSVPVYDTMTEAVSDTCLLYTSPSPRDGLLSRMPSSA